MVWRETWSVSRPLQPAAAAVRRLQLFMGLFCVGHLSNRETSAPPEVSAGGQVPSLPFGAQELGPVLRAGRDMRKY